VISHRRPSPPALSPGYRGEGVTSPSMHFRSRHPRAAAILICGACAFLLLLGWQDVVNTHEARVAQTAREMAASGWPWGAQTVEVPAVRIVRERGQEFLKRDPSGAPLRVNPWLVPVLTGEIRLQKPPLPYWSAAILFRLFGERSGAARFVPALLGAVATLVVYDLARRLIGRRAAPVAALLWVSSYFVVSEFRKTMADPYLAFFSLACVWAWVRATGSGRPTGWLMLFYLSLALGLLAKGPVVLVHVGIAIAAYHLCYRRPAPLDPLGHGAGLAILLAVALPWPLAVWRSVPHALELWRYESVGELADNRSNAAPFWAYLPKLPYLALPWTPLWASALLFPFRRRRRALLFPVAWYATTVLFFSFVNLKKDAYLLPVMPAQVLLVAQFASAAVALARLRRRPKWLDPLASVQTVVIAALAVVVAALLARELKIRTAAGVPFAAVALVACALTVGAAVVAVVSQIHDPRPHAGSPRSRWLLTEAVAGAVAVAAFVAVYNVAKENRRSPRAFAEVVRRRLAPDGPGGPRALHRESLPPTVAFYLPLHTGREETARTVIVVAGKNGRAGDVAAAFATETGHTVIEARAVALEKDSNPDRWTLFELTLANRRGYASRE